MSLEVSSRRASASRSPPAGASKTYAFAPVAGFGWLLLAMGLAQCQDEWTLLRVIYIGMFVLVLFYSEVPWAGLLARV